MSGYLPLTFIEKKLMDLENALFFSLSESVLKLPTSVVKILDADELGQLWFLIPRPSQMIQAFEESFPVKLDFFRKGSDFYVKILGKAFLVHDPEEINSLACLDEVTKQRARENEIFLTKVLISHAEYVEKAPAQVSTKIVLHQLKNKIYRWFQLGQEERLGYQKIPAEVKYGSPATFLN
jgi:Pyridoxamine 5'-phosphate oxidase like